MESQAIINTMEVLSTRPLTELVTEATVKVCWVSETSNDNGTVITRDVGREIAATLPGAPVVGFFDPNTGDFSDHGKQIVIERNKVSIKDLTKPYGFVSPLEAPWYQDFLENGVVRTYLMCKAFLWTRQYEEARLIKNKGQSMELDEEDYSGYYENDDVFIFTHAVLSKLCVLGDDCPPCFDGANIVTTYSKSYTPFVDELEKILGKKYYVVNDRLVEKTVTPEFAKVIMESETINTENIVETEAVETPVAEASEPVVESTEPEVVEATTEFSEEAPTETVVEEVQASVEVPSTEFADSEVVETVEASQVEVAETPVVEVVDYAAINAELEQQIAEYKSLNEILQSKVTSLESELNVYHAKEKEQENNSKKEIIKEYNSLLSEDEIKPFEEKVDTYSLDELEAKLSVTYARKQRAALHNEAQSMQVNVDAFNAIDSDSNLPEFMKKAMDYDRVNGL